MAQQDGLAALSARGTALAYPEIHHTVNALVAAEPSVDLRFSTSPQGSTFSYSAGGTTFVTSAKLTPTNTLITFTATAQVPAGVLITEYRWNFGDGTLGYGSVATHTYKVLSANGGGSPTGSVQAVLRATDSRGRHWYARQSIYLT